MPHFQSAWATISGRVFVEDFELQDELAKLFGPPPPAWDGEEGCLGSYTEEQKQEAFENVARRKLWERFPDDTSMKVNDMEIDMKTYLS